MQFFWRPWRELTKSVICSLRWTLTAAGRTSWLAGCYWLVSGNYVVALLVIECLVFSVCSNITLLQSSWPRPDHTKMSRLFSDWQRWPWPVKCQWDGCISETGRGTSVLFMPQSPDAFLYEVWLVWPAPPVPHCSALWSECVACEASGPDSNGAIPAPVIQLWY